MEDKRMLTKQTVIELIQVTQLVLANNMKHEIELKDHDDLLVGRVSMAKTMLQIMDTMIDEIETMEEHYAN